MRDRVSRLIALTRLLTARPAGEESLQNLALRLGVAKSTLSEDVATVREALLEAGLGRVETQVGPGGGIRFQAALDENRAAWAVRAWCEALAQPERLTADGFLYMTDLLFDPRLVDPLAQLLAERFFPLEPRHIVTVETKGIPLALAVARELGITVVLLRRDNRLSEGSSLSINYLSGSSHRIQSMSLARRTPVRDAPVVFVDDFLKAGGTARAAADLLTELNAQVLASGVLVATERPAPKLIDRISSCLIWSEDGHVRPSAWVQERLGLTLSTEAT
jgi:purine operon repressor